MYFFTALMPAIVQILCWEEWHDEIYEPTNEMCLILYMNTGFAGKSQF